MSDGVGLVLSFVFVFVVVGLAEGLRRSGRISFDFSRKFIHVGIGTWILPTVLIFHSPWAAAGPPAVFVAVNLLSLRGKWTKAMDAEAGSNVGTVLFPLSFVILLVALWGQPGGRSALTAGILSMAWGDAAAALVGLRYGRHRYRVGSGHRSLEGSAAMFFFTALAVVSAGIAVGPAPYPLILVLGAAVLATLLEGVSRWGMDNLLVPVGTALFLWSTCKPA